MAIFRKGKEISWQLHEGKKIKQIYHIGKKYLAMWISSATKDAINAAFGAEAAQVIADTNTYLNGIAITDLDRAQQLAMFINEDPLLVCSIVEASKMRWLVASGPNNIDMGIPTSNATILKGTFRFTQSVGGVHIGYHPGNDSQDWRLFNLNGTLYWDCGSGRINQACALNSVAEIEVGYGYIILNGTKKTSTAGGTIAKGNIGFAVDAAVDCRDKIEIYDGADWHTFAPFISKDGVAGLVDIFAGTTHFPQSGAFTIQLTDKEK